MLVNAISHVGNINFKCSEIESEQDAAISECLEISKPSCDVCDALKAQVLYKKQDVTVKTKESALEKLKGSGTQNDPYIVYADISTSQNTKTSTLFNKDYSSGTYYKNIITYDSDLPDVPALTLSKIKNDVKSMSLWEEYADTLREMQYNNDKLNITCSDDELIEYIAEKTGLSKEAITAELIHANITPVEYINTIITNALEDSKRLYKSFEPTTKEGYLYRGLKIFSDPNFNNEFHCNDFANMMNNLQKGQTCIIDYAPMCAGALSLASEYSGNAILKIKVPTGAKLLRYKDEYRFPPKAQFLVNEIKELQGGFKIYDLEYILPTE